MKKLIVGALMVAAAVARAAMWEGLTEENHVFGPKVSDRDLLGKVVLYYMIGTDERNQKTTERVEALWKGYDKKRFCVLAVYNGDKEKAAAEFAKQKVSFPVYAKAKLASDTNKRDVGSIAIVSQFGKVLAATTQFGAFSRDHETILVEAVTAVGQPPNIIPGISLDKYKALKNKLKLGVNLKSVIKSLEKDVAAADKKSATAQVKAKAEEAAMILSAIREGKSDIESNMKALAEINPVEAYDLMAKFVKSFPDEAADYKEQLAELKTKAAEFKKQK